MTFGMQNIIVFILIFASSPAAMATACATAAARPSRFAGLLSSVNTSTSAAFASER